MPRFQGLVKKAKEPNRHRLHPASCHKSKHFFNFTEPRSHFLEEHYLGVSEHLKKNWNSVTTDSNVMLTSREIKADWSEPIWYWPTELCEWWEKEKWMLNTDDTVNDSLQWYWQLWCHWCFSWDLRTTVVASWHWYRYSFLGGLDVIPRFFHLILPQRLCKWGLVTIKE